jgi:DNA-binding NarL/FixJ family response regulator
VDNRNPSILIVDDDPGFREMVSVLCGRLSYSCVEAGSADEALGAARLGRPDVVLLDVMLGGTSGYEVCRELREEFGERLPIIFLSGARTASSDRVAGLLLGADDYLTKPVEPGELLARVQRAIARSASDRRHVNGAAARLTVRELDVLKLLAEGLGTEAIAERLFISPKTVGTHVQRILAKLDLHSRAAAVAFAYREGLVEEEVSAHVSPDGLAVSI